MRLFYLLQVLPFVLLLFSSLRGRAIVAAIAGFVAGVAAATSLGIIAAALPWGELVAWLALLVISLVMAVTEAVAAAIVARGGFFVALLLALGSHGIVLYALARHASELGHVTIYAWLIPPALFGGAAAAFGARR